MSGAQAKTPEEGLLMISDLLPDRIREHRVPVEKVSHPAVRVGEPHLGELLWVDHRKHAQANRIQQLENRRIGADAEGQGYDRDGSEARIPLQLAGAVAEILPEDFERAESPQLAAGFFEPGDVAELAAGSVGSFVRRNALLAQFPLTHGEVKLHLVVQVAVKLAAPDQSLHPKPKVNPAFAEHRTLPDRSLMSCSDQSLAMALRIQRSASSVLLLVGPPAQAGSITRAIAMTIRFHATCSASRYLRPVAVSW